MLIRPSSSPVVLLAVGLLCACASQRQPTESGTGEVSLPAPEPAASPVPAAGGNVVIAAMTFLDRPYQSGGQSADTGFDCSGFTRYVFAQALGIDLPRSAEEQALAPTLRPVSSRNGLQAGDLVFFNTQKKTFSHVGIYLGDGRFIHAPRTGTQVRIESMGASYWSRRYTGARRAPIAASTP